MIAKLLKDEVQQYIKDHQNDDPFLLSLQSKQSGDFPLKEAIEQIHSFRKAKNKLPTWAAAENIIWPPPLSVEQSSSEITAKFKAELLAREIPPSDKISVADLTGGLGIDSFFFASIFGEVHYAEKNKALAELAGHNFQTLDKSNIVVHQLPAEKFLADNKIPLDAIYLDPSRRDRTRKVFLLEDCSPNLSDILPACFKSTHRVLVKLSPLMDLTKLIKDILPNKIWVLSVKNEVKEILCLIEKDKKEALITAIDLPIGNGDSTSFKFHTEEEASAESDFSMPLNYIYKPSPALLKTGAFKLIGQRFGLKKIHINSHLYTSDDLIKAFPGRIFQLKKILRQDKKEVTHEIPKKQANLLTANYPLPPEQLKKKLGLKDGGEDYLIGTTLMNGKRVLMLCGKVIISQII